MKQLLKQHARLTKAPHIRAKLLIHHPATVVRTPRRPPAQRRHLLLPLPRIWSSCGLNVRTTKRINTPRNSVSSPTIPRLQLLLGEGETGPHCAAQW